MCFRYHYTGYLTGNHVVVKHTGDMDFLYRMVSDVKEKKAKLFL